MSRFRPTRCGLRVCLRMCGMLVLAFVGLQLYFALRIAAFGWIDPASTAFERSGIYQNARAGIFKWSQTWTPYRKISVHLKRAVISSEDDMFVEHDGVYWAALEHAWEKNAQEQKKADARNRMLHQGGSSVAQKKLSSPSRQTPPRLVQPKLVGGSTITQQLAKNLFLSAERSYLRKAEELFLALMLETLLSKPRIYEIYLNHVELGVGIYGMQAGAQHYFKKTADRLDAYEAARLAVLLPAPKRYQKSFGSSQYQHARALTLVARMHQVSIP